MKTLYKGFQPTYWIGKCHGCTSVFKADDYDLRDLKAVFMGDSCKSDCPACGLRAIVLYNKQGTDEANATIVAIPNKEDKPTPPPGRELTGTHN